MRTRWRRVYACGMDAYVCAVGCGCDVGGGGNADEESDECGTVERDEHRVCVGGERVCVRVWGGEGRTHLQDDPRLELARPRLHLAARHQRLDGGRQAAPAELLKELARSGAEEEARQAEEVGPLLDAERERERLAEESRLERPRPAADRDHRELRQLRRVPAG